MLVYNILQPSAPHRPCLPLTTVFLVAFDLQPRGAWLSGIHQLCSRATAKSLAGPILYASFLRTD
jgi:hypothetical protein